MMTCEKCRSANDADAVYCVNCGSPLAPEEAVAAAKPKRKWWYVMLLAPILAFALGIGYYKFYLPQGVAAVVNGEEISLADVDAAMRDFTDGKDVPEDMRPRMRHAVLSRMITERIAWQEARKAGFSVTQDEVNAAVERSRTASGMDQKEFAAKVRERYGSMAAFRTGLEKQLVVSRFIDAKVVAGAPDAAAVSARLDQWLRDITAKAVVRMALAEELPAAGCGCCGGNKEAAPGQGCDPRKRPSAAAQQLSPQAREAQKAALTYWKERNGEGQVDTKLQDFGCHIQVDIVKNNRIAKSLRYQNGAIKEM